MYTKKELEKMDAYKQLEKMGFHGFTYNHLCYNCKKFYGRCKGIKGESNFPCVKFVQEKDIQKMEYTLAKELIYQVDKLYDGKKHGVIVMSVLLDNDSGKILKIVDFAKVYESDFNDATDVIWDLKKDETDAQQHSCYKLFTPDGEELEPYKGRNELLIRKTGKNCFDELQKLGLDVTKL